MSGNVAGETPVATDKAVLALDESRSDAELIELVRRGVRTAYGTLFTRHLAAAKNLAGHLTRCQAEADELVAEAFERVLARIRAGSGPDRWFRAYLLTALRHSAYDRTRRSKKVDLVEDLTEATGVSTAAISVDGGELAALARLERSLAKQAFARLPKRWQAVLWYTEVEGLSPAETASILGIKANAASALAYRARRGLRTAFLQVQVTVDEGEIACRGTSGRLAAYLRGDIKGRREKSKVAAHLDDCDHCRRALAELRELSVGLPA